MIRIYYSYHLRVRIWGNSSLIFFFLLFISILFYLQVEEPEKTMEISDKYHEEFHDAVNEAQMKNCEIPENSPVKVSSEQSIRLEFDWKTDSYCQISSKRGNLALLQLDYSCQLNQNLESDCAKDNLSLDEKTQKLNNSGSDFGVSEAVSIKKPVEKPNTEVKLYKCSHCEYCTGITDNLVWHIKAVHLKEKPFKCSHCEFSAAFKSLLSNHVKAVHLKEKPFKCSDCEYGAAKKCDVSRHMKAVHLKEKLFKCSECPYSASRKSHLSTHVKTVHLKEKPFKCSDCEYTTARKCDLSQHVTAVHLKEKPFKCSDCEYTTARKCDMSQHVTAVHLKEKPFKCSHCEYSATNMSNLSQHVTAVHLKRETVQVF